MEDLLEKREQEIDLMRKLAEASMAEAAGGAGAQAPTDDINENGVTAEVEAQIDESAELMAFKKLSPVCEEQSEGAENKTVSDSGPSPQLHDQLQGSMGGNTHGTHERVNSDQMYLADADGGSGYGLSATTRSLPHSQDQEAFEKLPSLKTSLVEDNDAHGADPADVLYNNEQFHGFSNFQAHSSASSANMNLDADQDQKLAGHAHGRARAGAELNVNNGNGNDPLNTSVSSFVSGSSMPSEVHSAFLFDDSQARKDALLASKGRGGYNNGTRPKRASSDTGGYNMRIPSTSSNKYGPQRYRSDSGMASVQNNSYVDPNSAAGQLMPSPAMTEIENARATEKERRRKHRMRREEKARALRQRERSASDNPTSSVQRPAEAASKEEGADAGCATQ